MKKNICAVLLCTAMLTSILTACAGNSNSDAKETTIPTEVTTTTAQTTETQPQTTAPVQTTAFPEEDTTTPIVSGVFDNGQFSMQIPEGWTSDESTGIPLFYSPESPVNGIETYFNVTVTRAVSDPLKATQDQWQNSLESIYGTGVTIKRFEVAQINGNQVLCMEFSLTVNELTALVSQYTYNQNGKSLTYTYTSGNTTQPAQCEEIFRTIKLA